MKNGMIRKIIVLVTAAVFLFSTTMVIRHQVEMRIGAQHAEAVIQRAVTPVMRPEKPMQTAESLPAEQQTEAAAEQQLTDASAPAAPIRVDFDALCAENRDVVAWLYCPDTPINYPVVQASDNQYYLRRLLDGSSNTAGTLFMDYRNAEDLSDWNSVIYGHNMRNDSMFGTLEEYQDEAYFREHPGMYLLTPEQDYAIEFFAGFTTPASDALYSTFTPDAAQAARLLETWMAHSDFESGIQPAADDRLVTLSTCSYEYDNARYVLIGILKECGR